MSRGNKVLTDNQDAYGHLLSDFHGGLKDGLVSPPKKRDML